MKAEEWLTYFIKIYGRRPKMTEVDEAIQNGSLLANRAEVESLLLASKKSFWQTLSQYVVTHKVAASVLAVSCMMLLGGGAIFAWHSLHSQAQQTSSLAVSSSSSQTGQKSGSDKSKQSSSRASESSSNSSSQSQNASSEAKTPAMDVDAIRNGDFSSIEGDWVSDGGHVVTITKSGLTKSEETGSTDGKTVVKDFNGQPMFYFADNGPGHGVNPFVPVPANQAAPSPDNSVKDTDRLVQIPESAGPGVVYTSYYRVKSKNRY
jgi:putative secreted protein